MELLPIVEAEAEADRLLREAHDRRDRMVKEALQERTKLLADIPHPVVTEPVLHTRKPDLSHLKERAAKNKAKAVKAILEAL